MPFDIPVEAFAVEVGGGAHPSIRSLGDRRLVYVEHRRAVRRSYRRRQLFLAVGLSGAFVVVAAAALAPGGRADGTVAGATSRAPAHAGTPQPGGTPGGAGGGAAATPPEPGAPSAEPAFLRARRASRRTASAPTSGLFATSWEPEDRDEHRDVRVVGSAGPLADDPFLVCTRGYESIYAGGYDAKSPGGRYRGAYQFDQVTWNGTARHLKLEDLIGVRPDTAPPAVQDLFAYTLYKWQGAGHWHDRCAGLP